MWIQGFLPLSPVLKQMTFQAHSQRCSSALLCISECPLFYQEAPIHSCRTKNIAVNPAVYLNPLLLVPLFGHRPENDMSNLSCCKSSMLWYTDLSLGLIFRKTFVKLLLISKKKSCASLQYIYRGGIHDFERFSKTFGNTGRIVFYIDLIIYFISITSSKS